MCNEKQVAGLGADVEHLHETPLRCVVRVRE